MANYVYCQNPDLTPGQQTVLTAAVTAGGTTLTVQNSTGFDNGTASNNYVVIGNIGSEKCEIKKISSISGTSITIAAMTYGHAKGEPVYLSFVNQINLYSSTTETGSFTTLAKFNLEMDNSRTLYVDSAGSSSTWYKVVYYNSQTTADVYPALADAIAFQIDINHPYVTLGEVKKKQGIVKSDWDLKIIQQIEYASRKIDDWTGRIWDKRTITAEVHDRFETPATINKDKLYPKYYPIVSVTSVTNDGTSLVENQSDSTGFFIVDTEHLELYSAEWSANRRGVSITYVAGFAQVPGYIKDACAEMVLVDLGLKTRTYVDETGIQQSVTLNSYSKELTDLLNQFRQPQVF